MSYRLVVLTHGPDNTELAESMASFYEHVTPWPADAYIHPDGKLALPLAYDVARVYGEWEWTVGGSHDQEGFCAATRACWDEEGAVGQHELVFWLEHDFRFLRDVDLTQLAAVLHTNQGLAQMQLMRGPVNEQERAAGGLFESRPGQYQRRGGWMEHSAYMTTNPCLMRRSFMAAHPWPDYPAQCEGRFGIDLVQAGYSFGVWGSGEPWVEHAGVRTGFGY